MWVGLRECVEFWGVLAWEQRKSEFIHQILQELNVYRGHPWKMGFLILPESTRRSLLYHCPLLEISLKAGTPVLI